MIEMAQGLFAGAVLGVHVVMILAPQVPTMIMPSVLRVRVDARLLHLHLRLLHPHHHRPRRDLI
jgi:hypothetical protein